MPRLNVYLSEDVYALAKRRRDSANLSDICARAIRDELSANETYRSAAGLLAKLRSPSDIELELAKRFGLKDVRVAGITDASETRDAIGRAAAKYLDWIVCDGSLLACAGGRQMWCMVRNLSPRRVRTTITALGLHRADPQLLHAHPNTLATLLSLLYAPRSAAHVIGETGGADAWRSSLPMRPHPSYFVISSCSLFERESQFADLLGHTAADRAIKLGACVDFAYNFLDEHGNEISLPIDSPAFKLGLQALKDLSKREDARVVLVAGGIEKSGAINTALKTTACNTLITDTITAARLIEKGGG